MTRVHLQQAQFEGADPLVLSQPTDEPSAAHRGPDVFVMGRSEGPTVKVAPLWQREWGRWLDEHRRPEAISNGQIITGGSSIPSLRESLQKVLCNLPPDCRQLTVWLTTPVSQNYFGLLFGKKWEMPDGLEELHIVNTDHTVLIHASNGKKFVCTEERYKKRQEVLKALQEGDGSGALSVTLRLDWKPAAKSRPLGELIQDAARQYGSFRAASRAYEKKTGDSIESATLSQYAQDKAGFISFERIARLALFLGMDVRDVIAAANARFRQFDVSDWSTSVYPILIETPEDLAFMEEAGKYDPDRRSIAWLVYARRKDPLHYVTLNELGLRELMPPLNPNQSWQEPWGRQTLRRLATRLKVPMSELVSAFNHSRYGSDEKTARILGNKYAEFKKAFPDENFEGVLGRIFFDHPVYVDERSGDIEKILSYAKKPGSLGQLLFALRNADPDFPSCKSYSARFGWKNNFFLENETLTGIKDLSYPHWITVFTRLGLPQSWLDDLVGYKSQDVRHLLGKALVGLKKVVLADQNGFGREALPRLVRLQPDSYVRPQTLVRVGRALPGLDQARLYRQVHPTVIKAFPELKAEPPVLLIDEVLMKEAPRFSLAEALYRCRMAENLTNKGLAGELGLTDRYLANVMTTLTHIADDAVLLRVADRVAAAVTNGSLVLTGIDPAKGEVHQQVRRLVYLHDRPQILSCFPHGDGVSEPSVFPESDYKVFARYHDCPPKAQEELRGILTRRARAMGRRLPESNRQFAALLEELFDGRINRRKAEFYLYPGSPLGMADAHALCDLLPEASFQDWYEYVNGVALTYWLGKKSDGTIDYSPPEEGEKLADLKACADFLESRAASLPNRAAVARQTGLHAFRSAEPFSKMIRGDVQDLTLEQTARALGVNRRFLYFHFHRRHLMRVPAAAAAYVPTARLPMGRGLCT